MSIRLAMVLREWRKGSGVTLRQVSEESGVSVSTLHRVEMGIRKATSTSQDNRRADSNGLDGVSLGRLIVWLLSEPVTEPDKTEAAQS